MVSEKVKNHIKSLGLTEYETRVYVSLVSLGPTTAGDLSESSDVPQSRIYDVLSSLEKRGWVESQSGRPARYRAKPPSEVLRLVKIKEKERLKEASEVIQKELKPIYEKESEVEKPDVWTIRGPKDIIGRAEEMFTNAEIEILLSIPFFPEEFSELTDFLTILDQKDLGIRILTSKNADFLEGFDLDSNIEIRHREPLFGGGIIVDGKEVLLILQSGDSLLGIWSDEIGLAKFAEEYFEYLWKGSKENND